MSNNSMTTAVSLFAGVGGFDLALERAGVKVVASVEWDKNAQNVLRKQFPNAQVFGDIQGVTGEQLIQSGFTPSDGIITGGFPCQDLSVAGKRAGLAGLRSGLFWEICRLLDETRTQTFILENVPGLLSSNNGRDMAVVIEALVERGYRIAWRVLDAQYFGVPQRRRRVFIVGCLGNQGRSPEEILAIAEGRAGYLAKSNAPRKGSSTTIARGAESSGERAVAGTLAARDYKGLAADDLLDNKAIVGTLQARMGTGGNNMPMVATVFPIDDGREVEKNQNGTGIGNEGDPAYTLDRLQSPAVVMAFDTFNQTVSDTSQTIKSHSANNENIGTVLIPNEPMAVDIYNATIDKDVTHTLKAANQPMGVPSVLIPGEQMSVSFLHGEISKTSQTLRKGEGSYISVGGVLAKSTVFPTLSATNNPSRSPQSSEVTAQIDAMVKATSTVRRLTPTECERLQGFPDGWTEGQADSHRYKQMGNAVAVPVVEWIINRIIK
jgi:DNA (cytosine-5)-methyltransferase 1